MTTIELRRIPILAEANDAVIVVQRWKGKRSSEWFGETTRHYHNLYLSDFDNLGPVACAELIRAQEATFAQEWAGDK